MCKGVRTKYVSVTNDNRQLTNRYAMRLPIHDFFPRIEIGSDYCYPKCNNLNHIKLHETQLIRIIQFVHLFDEEIQN